MLARGAEAAHYEVIAVSPKLPSARTGVSVTPAIDPNALVTPDVPTGLSSPPRLLPRTSRPPICHTRQWRTVSHHGRDAVANTRLLTLARIPIWPILTRSLSSGFWRSPSLDYTTPDAAALPAPHHNHARSAAGITERDVDQFGVICIDRLPARFTQRGDHQSNSKELGRLKMIDDPVVQILREAAARGRQLRLAREQTAQNETRSDGDAPAARPSEQTVSIAMTSRGEANAIDNDKEEERC